MDHAPMPGAEHLAEPLRSRWSPSIFDDRHRLTHEQIGTLLHAAQWAPNSGNSQRWAFVRAGRGSASHAVPFAHLSRGNAGWVPRASLALVTATQVAPDEDGNGGRSEALAHYDLGQAAAHVTLQARAMGLHAHQFGGFDQAAVAEGLGVPAHYRVMSGIAIGARGNPEDVSERDQEREQRPRSRRPLAEIVHGSAWGEPWPPPGEAL
eukprot:gene38301-43383_t